MKSKFTQNIAVLCFLSIISLSAFSVKSAKKRIKIHHQVVTKEKNRYNLSSKAVFKKAFEAIEQNNMSQLRACCKFLNRQRLINFITYTKGPLLHYAILKNSYESTLVLLQNGADILLETPRGKTPEMCLSHPCDYKLLKLVICKRDEAKKKQRTLRKIAEIKALQKQRKEAKRRIAADLATKLADLNI